MPSCDLGSLWAKTYCLNTSSASSGGTFSSRRRLRCNGKRRGRMNKKYNGTLIGKAKRLRREMTKEERHLWYDCLKQLPVTVHRQKVLGNFIVDFYIASCKIVIEVDGAQHYEDVHRQKDIQRDSELNQMGCTVLRYSNADINQRFQSVCDDIWSCIYKGKDI